MRRARLWRCTFCTACRGRTSRRSCAPSLRAPTSTAAALWTRKEFSRCLKSAELGLTRKEINLLLCEVDENGDGLISYEEFVPLCFNILVERFKEDVLAEAALQNADALTQLLRDEFDAAKATATQAVWTEAGEGHLPFRAVKKVLKRLSDRYARPLAAANLRHRGPSRSRTRRRRSDP